MTQLHINIPFRPAYVSDRGIQKPAPQMLVTLSDRGSIAAAIVNRWLDQLDASVVAEPTHTQLFRPHRIADGHRVQRIAGLPLSFVERAPRAKRLTWRESHEPFDHLDFADVAWEDEDNNRTPLDMPDDGVDPCLPLKNFDSHGVRVSEYYGFDGRDTRAPKLPRGRFSRPVTHDPADLERMADQILDADDADQLRPTIATQKMDLPRDDRKPWPVTQRTSPSDWEYRRYTYTLGHKRCPRCNGEPRRFAQRPCRYCRTQGGWAITRTRMTPWHPEHGFQLTPPRLDGAAVHTLHWRTRGEYYGDARVYRRDQRHLSGVAVEVRRRYLASFPSTTTQEAAAASFKRFRIAA